MTAAVGRSAAIETRVGSGATAAAAAAAAVITAVVVVASSAHRGQGRVLASLNGSCSGDRC